MQNFISKILKRSPEGDGAPAGSPKPGEQQPPTPNIPPTPAAGDKQYDEFGYEVVSAQKDPKEAGTPPKEGADAPKDPAAESAKVEKSDTGYEEEIKIEDPPAPAPITPPPAATDLDKKLEGLHKSFAEKVKLQITDLGLDGEKLDKFIAFKKQEQKDADDWGKAQAAESQRQDAIKKQGWQKELKEDPVFGGDKFNLNLVRGQKVLDEYLPELKKELTDAKQMLRPSVMRGLMRLAEKLYPERVMSQGDPPTPLTPEDDKKPNDPLAFYQ